ncbi:hypothetical protein FB566_2138 [Stackebrandtia endophytica]|uniref:Uncharacterized protein n=1 Tax=Stackebrandtia endophytica TaxID=1496996 RepID=A0A543AVK1_9ACTN|nr:hypothetical protein [Stackebrandtia endophytica]TQL76605.1 hypothetical protein FB566_2138 [Stackebrandtia endophytica]
MTTTKPTRKVFHGQYRTALTGMYGSTVLTVRDPAGDRTAQFCGMRGDALTVDFLALESVSGLPAKVDDTGALTPEAITGLIADARNQVAVAAGRPVLWACERAQDADVLGRLFDGPLADLRADAGTAGIEVAHLPYDLLLRQWRERAEAQLWTPPLDLLPDSVFTSEQPPPAEPVPAIAPKEPPRSEPIRVPTLQPPGPHRPIDFGFGRNALMVTSLIVPLGIPGPQTYTPDEYPYREITLGGEVTNTGGAESLIWGVCATRFPGTLTSSLVMELIGISGKQAVDSLRSLFKVGLLAQVDMSEPAAVYEFAQTYRMLPVTSIPAGGQPGEIIQAENDVGAPIYMDALIGSIANEGMTTRNLVEACTPHGKVRPPDSRPRMFKSPNLFRRHPSVVNENGVVGWLLENAIPLVGEGILAFDLAES